MNMFHIKNATNLQWKEVQNKREKKVIVTLHWWYNQQVQRYVFSSITLIRQHAAPEPQPQSVTTGYGRMGGQ